jgi:transposase
MRKALDNAQPPRYHLTKPRPCPTMGPVQDATQSWLTQDQQAPRKQRHTARRIYDRLVEEYGFVGAQSTVLRYVAQVRPKMRVIFIPLEADWGQQAQVDWGHGTVRIGNIQEVAHLFCLRMRASGVPFAWAAPTEKLEAFMEGHCRAFAWLGGVPGNASATTRKPLSCVFWPGRIGKNTLSSPVFGPIISSIATFAGRRKPTRRDR